MGPYLFVVGAVAATGAAPAPADIDDSRRTGVERIDTDPEESRFRRFSLGFGARALYVFGCRTVVGECAVGPAIAATWEIGQRRVAWLGELYSAPMPAADYDLIIEPALMLATGISFGGKVVRGSAVAMAGIAAGIGGEARLTITPWRTQRGQRHGIELSAGTLFYFPMFGISYRFLPYRANIRRMVNRRAKTRST